MVDFPLSLLIPSTFSTTRDLIPSTMVCPFHLFFSLSLSDHFVLQCPTVETFVSMSSPFYASLLGIGEDVSSGESEEEDNGQETSTNSNSNSNSNSHSHAQYVEEALDREQILKDQRKNLCIELLL